MSLMEKIPRDFYKLFTSKYTDYYMLFLVSIHEEMSRSWSVLGLTEKECRAVMNEKIASETILWDEENQDEDGEFLTRANMASVCLKRFVDWGWLRQDYDETLNSYVVTFPEYSQMYVELFERLFDENDSMERESVMTIYSHLYTYNSDAEKNNDILKSALRTSKRLVQMLANMQDGMREYFDELSRQKDFKGIQDVLVKEINNSDSRKYAILTTTDSFYRYKEAVKELIDKNLGENEVRRIRFEREMAGYELDSVKYVRCKRAVALSEEAAETLMRIERQFDAIERRYNKLIEQKTIFAGRAAARIRYILQEGVQEEEQTVVLVNLLNQSKKKEEILTHLAERMKMSAAYRVMTENSLYQRKNHQKEEFRPQAVNPEAAEERPLDSFVLKPLYTQKEIREFVRKNEHDGVFRVTEDTVHSVEDLEKLFFVWQEATENAESGREITLGEERGSAQGFRFSGLEIREVYTAVNSNE